MVYPTKYHTMYVAVLAHELTVIDVIFIIAGRPTFWAAGNCCCLTSSTSPRRSQLRVSGLSKILSASNGTQL